MAVQATVLPAGKAACAQAVTPTDNGLTNEA